jgi:hypothetical protein
MVGGTSFHRVILKASLGRNEQKQQQGQQQKLSNKEKQNRETPRQLESIADLECSTCPLTTPARL